MDRLRFLRPASPRRRRLRALESAESRFRYNRPVAERSAHVVIDGPGFASARIELREGITAIGRLRGNDITLDDAQVSRHHARIAYFEGEATFQDLDSHNGSLVNDRRATSRVLRSGDIIRVGPFRLRFLAEAASEVPRAAAPSAPRAAPVAGPSPSAAVDGPLVTLLLRAIDTAFSGSTTALPRTLAALEIGLRTERAALVRSTPDGRLQCAAGREGGQPHERPRVEAEIVQWAVQRRFPVAVEDPQADPRFRAARGRRPTACVPVGDEAEPWGALYVERSGAPFSPAEVDCLQAVARLAHHLLEQPRGHRPPWGRDPSERDDVATSAARVVAIELAPPSGPQRRDTVSDAASGDPWLPGRLVAIARAAEATSALWVGQDDRRVTLALPASRASASEADLVRRLAMDPGAAHCRVGLAIGPLTLRSLELLGAARAFASGPALVEALRYVQWAEWGGLVASAELRTRLRAGGFAVRDEADGTVRASLAEAPALR